MGKNKEIRIKLYSQRLSGKSLEWYTLKTVNIWRTWDDFPIAFMYNYKFKVKVAADKIYVINIKLKLFECCYKYDK